jgi:hypothetical protein
MIRTKNAEIGKIAEFATPDGTVVRAEMVVMCGGVAQESYYFESIIDAVASYAAHYHGVDEEEAPCGIHHSDAFPVKMGPTPGPRYVNKNSGEPEFAAHPEAVTEAAHAASQFHLQ